MDIWGFDSILQSIPTLFNFFTKIFSDSYAQIREENAHLKEGYAQIREENAHLKEENVRLGEENMSLKETVSVLATKIIKVKTETPDTPQKNTTSKHKRCSRRSTKQVDEERRLLIRKIVTYAAKNSQSRLIHTI